MRFVFLSAFALVLVAGSANAGAPAPPRPVAERFATCPVVVVGKVTAIEKGTVEAAPYVGATYKVPHKIAVVKISENFAGADNTTHIKIGFITPETVPPPQDRPWRGPLTPQLKEGQDMLFFLTKHPTAGFYSMSWMNSSVVLKGEHGKQEVEIVRKFAAVLAYPLKGLKSDNADTRAETAAFLVMKYRAYPIGAAKVEEVAISAEESKLILNGLVEGKWKQDRYDAPNAMAAFHQLNLTNKDGWTPPALAKPIPGKPVDFATIQKDAFVKWLAGSGKDYRIKKLVPKK